MTLIELKWIGLGLVIFLNLVLAAAVYKRNPKSATSRVYVSLGIVVSLWLTAAFLSVTPVTDLFWARLTVCFATLMSVLFALLSYVMPSTKFALSEPKRWLFGIATGLVMALTLTGFVFSGITFKASAPQLVVAPGISVFGIFTTLATLAAIFILIRKIRKSSGVERVQLQFVLLGIAVMIGLIITTVMLPLILFQSDALVILMPVYTLVFLGMTAFAIIRYRFLDIRLIITRAISFVAFIALTAGAYSFVLFFLVDRLLGIRIENFIFISTWILAVVAILTFVPAQEGIRRLTRRLFFQNHYETRDVLSSLTKIMVDTIDLHELSSKILERLSQDIGISAAAFLFVDRHEVTGMEIVGYGPEFKVLAPKFEALFHTSQDGAPVIFEELEEGPLKSLFRAAGVSIGIPISVESDEVAILIVGTKLSGEIYTDQDISFFGIFASESGIAIQNAKSYEEIKRFNRELEMRVADRTKELEKSQKQELARAEEVSKLKDEFVFFAVHELRAPAAAIKGFLDMTTSGAARLPKAVQSNLDAMAQASDHLSQLVNDLLEIARSDSGTITLNTKPCEIAPILDRVIEETKSLARQKNLAVSVGVPARLAAVCDGEKLREVFMNLVSNGIKYNKNDGTLSVTARPDAPKKQVIFEIADTGLGIPPDQQDRIFQKFFRATTKETQDILGTGLGLFICRMLVNRMGGQISFTSVEGKGTTFTFTLPLAA